MRNRRLRNELKNLMSIIAGIVIVLCIVFFPMLYFKYSDENRYNIGHPMKKITFELDTDVENVLMVNQLHRILESPYQLQKTETAEFLQEEEVMLKAEFGDNINVITEIKNHEILTMNQDKVTEKVIQAEYKQKNYDRKKYIKKLCTEQGDQQLQQELKRFLKYLGLDIIDDWIYNGVLDFYNGYDEAKRAGAEFEWYMSSDSAKLALYARPEKNGVKYYFQVTNE